MRDVNGRFIKGHEVPQKWRDSNSVLCKGRKLPQWWKDKIGAAQKGMVNSPEAIAKMAKTRSENFIRNGYLNTPETRKKMSKAKKGLRISPKTEFKKGHKPWNYDICDGNRTYGGRFREKLKVFIRKVYNNQCQECGIHQDKLLESLHVHHIDYDKKNNSRSNFIPLCRSCHSGTNVSIEKRKYWTRYYRSMVIFKPVGIIKLRRAA